MKNLGCYRRWRKVTLFFAKGWLARPSPTGCQVCDGGLTLTSSTLVNHSLFLSMKTCDFIPVLKNLLVSKHHVSGLLTPLSCSQKSCGCQSLCQPSSLSSPFQTEGRAEGSLVKPGSVGPVPGRCPSPRGALLYSALLTGQRGPGCAKPASTSSLACVL